MTPPPKTAAEIPDEWIAATREAASQHEGVPLRANGLRIEAWSINRGRWLARMLPGGGTLFATKEDCDAVFAKLRA